MMTLDEFFRQAKEGNSALPRVLDPTSTEYDPELIEALVTLWARRQRPEADQPQAPAESPEPVENVVTVEEDGSSRVERLTRAELSRRAMTGASAAQRLRQTAGGCGGCGGR